ncbi:TonB family protein [Mesobacterium pallidum]|uniref:TonB family protein n=1 Tax=Mesobacterium pallidum TaxID=2872037 RepID=UPI001EE33AAB|nr:TonB family protein [Mesobacterium pallidum]
MILRAAEAVGFLALATGLHALVLLQPEVLRPGAPPARAAAQPALQAGSALSDLVARWEAPPEVAPAPTLTSPDADSAATPALPGPQDSPRLARPESSTLTAPRADSAPERPAQALRPPSLAPEMPEMAAIPLPDAAAPAAPDSPPEGRATPQRPAVSAIAAPQHDSSLPAVDTRPSTPPDFAALDRSPRPVSRPDRPAPRAQKAPAAPRPAPNNPRQSAAQKPPTGQGTVTQKSRQGSDKPSQKSNPGLTGTAAAAARDRWGAAVRAQVTARAQRDAVRATGKVQISVSVSPSGRLLGASVTQSSGSPRLDAAALKAARKASLPRAPKGLSDASTTFRFFLSFRE